MLIDEVEGDPRSLGSAAGGGTGGAGGAGGAAAPDRCVFCGHPRREVVVHGHVQCATCGTNVHPCCNGETACPPSPPPD